MKKLILGLVLAATSGLISFAAQAHDHGNGPTPPSCPEHMVPVRDFFGNWVCQWEHQDPGGQG